MAQPASDPEQVARLIEKAIRRLPEREQSTVLRYLLQSRLDLHAMVQPPGALQRAFREFDLGPELARVSVAGAGREHQTLPVRLPEQQYARLKEWCSRRGFSMATVIRGLVERFLDAQGLPPPPGG